MLLASYELSSAIRWVGAAYLVWFGATAFFGTSAVAARPRFHGLANRVAGTMLVAAGISVARLELERA